MARRPRIVSDGAVYHMMARGVRKSDLYIDDDDRRKFLKLLAAAVKKFGCLCYSYNLMGNHYHLVILTTRKNFSRVAQYLNGEYAKYFNRRHKYTGHVFDGRCNAPLIEDNNYLIAALAYVARNPVAANLVKDAADWKWSSYRATIGCADSSARRAWPRHADGSQPGFTPTTATTTSMRSMSVAASSLRSGCVR
jgi:putative transposase